MLTFIGLYSKIFAEIAEKKKNPMYLYVCWLLFMLISCITLHYKEKKDCVAFILKRVPINIKNMGV